MSGPFDSFDEARMRVLAQWEYEGKLTEPITLETVARLRNDIWEYAPDPLALPDETENP